ncbi:MAG: hypothetical protein IIA33_11415 [Planctomycetes bacterium]|nr:hypothetical protein [Planctomycetota bacterium]
MAGVFQLIRSILRRLLFGLGSVKLVLELSVLGAKLVDFLLQFLVLPLRLGKHALPVASLLSQRGQLTPQLGHLAEQLLDPSSKLRLPPGVGG